MANIKKFKIDGYEFRENVLVDTTANWNADTSIIAQKDYVYIYSDKYTNDNGDPVPAFKVGDGTSYLVDMPFNEDLFVSHAADTTLHITSEEREFWNNKVRAYIDALDTETLVLTTN